MKLGACSTVSVKRASDASADAPGAADRAADTMADVQGPETRERRGGRPSKARGAPNTSDAADARWTVRGVPANVRAMAVKAAETRGMTTGDWLSEVVIAFVRADKAVVTADASEVPADQVPALPLPPEFKAALDVLSDIQNRLGKIEAEREKPRRFGLFGRRA